MLPLNWSKYKHRLEGIASNTEIGNLLGWLSNCLKATIGHYCSHRLYSSSDAAFFFLGSSSMEVISTFIKTEHHRTRPTPSGVVRPPLPPYDVVLPFRMVNPNLVENIVKQIDSEVEPAVEYLTWLIALSLGIPSNEEFFKWKRGSLSLTSTPPPSSLSSHTTLRSHLRSPPSLPTSEPQLSPSTPSCSLVIAVYAIVLTIATIKVVNHRVPLSNNLSASSNLNIVNREHVSVEGAAGYTFFGNCSISVCLFISGLFVGPSIELMGQMGNGFMVHQFTEVEEIVE
ncbi:hypothetical protein L1887_32652 [Cichorium endivia]|nr:hypothetical protein L1887_32652 [Cichorium endivia]